MYCGIHKLHNANGNEHIHRKLGRGRFLRHTVLLAADRRVGCYGNLVHGKRYVQGGAILSGKFSFSYLQVQTGIYIKI